MQNKPSEVNTYAPIHTSVLSVLVGMVLTDEWANGNEEVPEKRKCSRDLRKDPDLELHQ